MNTHSTVQTLPSPVGTIEKRRVAYTRRLIYFLVRFRKRKLHERLYILGATATMLSLSLLWTSKWTGSSLGVSICIVAMALTIAGVLIEVSKRVWNFGKTIHGKILCGLLAAIAGKFTLVMAEHAVGTLTNEDPSKFPHSVWLCTLIVWPLVVACAASIIAFICYTGYGLCGMFYHAVYEVGISDIWWKARTHFWCRVLFGSPIRKRKKPEMLVYFGRLLGLGSTFFLFGYPVQQSIDSLRKIDPYIRRSVVMLDFQNSGINLNLPLGTPIAYLGSERLCIAQTSKSGEVTFKSEPIIKLRKSP